MELPLPVWEGGGEGRCAPCAHAVVPKGLLGTSQHRLRILVAEDSPVNQKVVVRLLEKWGHTIESLTPAGTAAETAAPAVQPDAELY